MCLELNNKKTKKVKKGFKTNRSKYVKVYKIVGRYDNKKISIFTPNMLKKVKSGIIRSNRRTSNYPIKSDDSLKAQIPSKGCDFLIYKGIHVYLRKNHANFIKRYGQKVLTCKALKSDFVGCDKKGKHAVFSKIFLTKKEYSLALK